MENNSITSEKRRAPLFEIATVLAVIIIIAVTTSLAYRTIDIQSDSYSNYARAGQIIETLKDFHLAILKAESGQRGFLLTDDEKYLKHYNGVIDNLRTNIEELSNIYTIFPEQKKRIDKLVTLAKAKEVELRSTVNLARDDQERKAMKILMAGDGESLYNRMSTLIEKLHLKEEDYQLELSEHNKKSEHDARLLFFISILVSSVLLASLLIILNSNLKKERTNRLILRAKADELEEKVAERTKELVKYGEQLSRSNKELEDFAFVASHDLQEPLRKIRAFSERIQRSYADTLDEKGVDYLRRLYNAAERMSALIEDLLQFSRIKSRGKKFDEISLNETIDRVIDDLEVSIENHHAEIKVEVLPTIVADGSQMHQLFLNLLSNAIKFHRPGITPCINITYKITSVIKMDLEMHEHCIIVSDNGIGFEQEYSEKIFLPFQRLHAREEYDGTGIGLAVCRKIVERHGGRIEVASEPGSGTEFNIFLPTEPIDFDENLECS